MKTIPRFTATAVESARMIYVFLGAPTTDRPKQRRAESALIQCVGAAPLCVVENCSRAVANPYFSALDHQDSG